MGASGDDIYHAVLRVPAAKLRLFAAGHAIGGSQRATRISVNLTTIDAHHPVLGVGKAEFRRRGIRHTIARPQPATVVATYPAADYDHHAALCVTVAVLLRLGFRASIGRTLRAPFLGATLAIIVDHPFVGVPAAELFARAVGHSMCQLLHTSFLATILHHPSHEQSLQQSSVTSIQQT